MVEETGVATGGVESAERLEASKRQIITAQMVRVQAPLDLLFKEDQSG